MDRHLPSRREFLKAGSALGLGMSVAACSAMARRPRQGAPADLVLTNGRIATLDRQRPSATALAVKDGRFLAVGSEEDVFRHRGPETLALDAKGCAVIPGLNDSHLHVIRGGLNHNLELRWDGVPSLADALRMLRAQVERTPPPQWVRVVGGWSEFQFKERRMPTLDEVNALSGDTPVFILHLYDRALLNGAAVRAVGYTRDTTDPPGGQLERDRNGNPTGLLIARPNANILYATLAKGPKLSYDDQLNSSRQFMREMNRLGVTSISDAGGGFQNFPDDYRVVEELHRRGELTVRIAYNLFTQQKGGELEDFARWIKIVRPGQGDDFYRMNGGGEMLVFSAADYEDFLEPRPDLPQTMEEELAKVVTLLAKNRWPFRLHATYNESIDRFLNVLESVNREVPLTALRWFFDHAETISERNIERVRALGGGIAIQHRMAFQGEYFVDRYGKKAAERTPPIAQMLRAGLPVGAGTDGTRVASYNPWIGLFWLVSGKTVGGTSLYPAANRLDRLEALRLFTAGSAWFSGEEEKKGRIVPGQLADFAVLSADYFSVAEEEIRGIESLLTMVGGKLVYGSGSFAALGPKPLPVSPGWAPVGKYGGYWSERGRETGRRAPANGPSGEVAAAAGNPGGLPGADSASRLWGAHGCHCFAF